MSSYASAYSNPYKNMNPYASTSRAHQNLSYGVQSKNYNPQYTNHILNRRNIRRIEPTQILRDYRNGHYNNCGSTNHCVEAIYPANTLPCEGQEALNRVQNRVQETLRKKGCLIGGQKVVMNKKPRSTTKPVIEDIVGLKRRQVDNQGLVLAKKAAMPPSKRKEIPVQNSVEPGQKSTEHKNYVYKDITYDENKENDGLNSKNHSMYGHDEAKKLNTRKLLQNIKKEQQINSNIQNNKKQYNVPSAKCSFDNPLIHAMKTNSKDQYQTTNKSSFKHWHTSSFQTVSSRKNDRPVWADSKHGGHFVRNLPDKKVEGTGIMLSVKQDLGNRNKKYTNVVPRGGKTSFKSEYERSFSVQGSALKVC